MKRDETFREISDLLRSQTPDPQPSPGLESRILRALDQHQRPAPKRWWPWLLLPSALAATVIMMAIRPAPPRTAASIAEAPITEPPSDEPMLSQMIAGNPLNAETSTLSRDAERAGNFFINCLPSLDSDPE
ncbi:MAG: hypothetical protein ABIS50_26465 [Luteolibacter sp.]|uniref:hypothetical protein n=1 Tax=Luteolibacter sp. TaxID=1962973 RepID=UPI0032633488